MPENEGPDKLEIETATTSARFVNLVLGKDWGRLWAEVEKLSDEETRVFFETVVAAGFEPKRVVPGKLRGNYLDQDGSKNGTYPINSLCPFKVVGQDGDDSYFATGWLDCAVRRVVGARRGESHEQLIKAIHLEIKRSVPLKPIKLTAEGDLLREYPPSAHYFGSEYFVDHTRDNHNLSSVVGVHNVLQWLDGSWPNHRHAGCNHL